MTGDRVGTGAFHRIVVGVDGSASSHRALVWAARFALATNAEIVAVHAVETPAFVGGDRASGFPVSEDVRVAWKEWRAETARALDEEWCTPLRQARVPYSVETVDGGPRGLLGLANHQHVDAIVVGRRGRSGLAELVLGSFSHHLVHHSSYPVIVVPQESE
jgi:nucleotide-binding universal stress UspA family protein